MTGVRTFTSTATDPGARGRELGERHSIEVGRTVAAYRALFAARATRPIDVDAWAERAWAVIGRCAPECAEESAGIAEGARLPVHEVAMLNARTELLAVADPTGTADECSTVVALPDHGRPLAAQTWDWYAAMSENWLVWTFPLPDGHHVQTLTEYGVLGKIGVGSRGIGVLFNMLRHDDDARAEERGLGFPVHLLARTVLERARSVTDAVEMLTAATTSASTSVTVVDRQDAASVELSPGGPGVVRPSDGLLVRTNHFLGEETSPGCLAASIGPGSHTRRRTLLDAFADGCPSTAEAVVAAMDDHADVGAVCVHPDPGLEPVLRHATLATVVLDPVEVRLDVTAGGPCARRGTSAHR